MLQSVGWNQLHMLQEIHLYLRGWFSDATWFELTALGDTWILMGLLSPLIWRMPMAYFAFLASIPVGGMAIVVMKTLFKSPRPVADMLTQVSHMAEMHSDRLDSFPSGHSASVVAVLLIIWVAARSIHSFSGHLALCVLSLVLALTVLLSRMALGVHWPLDVVAGAALGWISGQIGLFAARRWGLRWFNLRIKLVVHALITASCWPLIQREPNFSDTPWLALLACGVTVLAWIWALESVRPSLGYKSQTRQS